MWEETEFGWVCDGAGGGVESIVFNKTDRRYYAAILDPSRTDNDEYFTQEFLTFDDAEAFLEDL